MIGISPLRNPIRSYAWGSRTAIATFLGRPSPSEEPQAELWMGAHPQAPSEVEIEGRWQSLAEAIDAVPEEILGPEIAARHDSTLPFLFKVLAAERALSIQAHPDRSQAAAGCRREDELGIARGAPERNYRDGNHKPEMLYALTPFVILRGFRPAAEILALMRRLELPELVPEIGEALSEDDLERFFSRFMSLDEERVDAVLARALRNIARGPAAAGGVSGRAPDVDPFAWVAKLAHQCPGDRCVLAPLYLHLLELSPGEAIFTGPGILHAYLDGTGIELMASSDNVVRGGLTSKHVDVAELLRILRFTPDPPRLVSSSRASGERRFEILAEEFDLAVVELSPGEARQRDGGGVEILLCARGEGEISSAGGAEIRYRRGDCFLVPAAVASYLIEGNATFFRAGIPRSTASLS